MSTKIFFDVETTGTNPQRHSIHQLAGFVEVDDEVVEKFDIKMRPHPKALIEDAAMSTCGVTEEQIRDYQPFEDAHKQFKKILKKYIDPYDKHKRAFMVGFNNRAFDEAFLKVWFELCGDRSFMSWFFPDSLDVMVLACEYLLDRRTGMPSFKLKRVAMELGLTIEKEKLHDAFYDVELTRDIYRIVTGREVEL